MPTAKAAVSAGAKKAPASAKRKKTRAARQGLGQADKLPGAAWQLWTHHVQATGPSWLFPVVCLGHLLCLRVTEILSLRGEDVDFEKGVVRVRPLKRQDATDKVLSEAAVTFLRKMKDDGVCVKRSKNTGLRGIQELNDVWTWPENPEHYLFPATRRDSQQERRTKDVVARAIRKARETFKVPHIPEVQPSRIRSHSGRHRCINDMKQHNVEREVGKKFARITDDGVYEKYGKLSAQQAGKKLRQNQELQTFWKQMY